MFGVVQFNTCFIHIETIGTESLLHFVLLRLFLEQTYINLLQMLCFFYIIYKAISFR